MQVPIHSQHRLALCDEGWSGDQQAWRKQRAGEATFACGNKGLVPLGRFLRRGYLVERGVGNFVGGHLRCSFNQL